MMKILRKFKNYLETKKNPNRIFDKIAQSSLYSAIVLRKILRFDKKIRVSKEYNIIIETSNICNAKCVMCPHPKMKREKMIMSDAVFELCIRRLEEERVFPAAFIVNGFGEPLTDKKIFERIRILKQRFPCSILKFYTNFNLATPDCVEKILESGLDEINVSFNGYSRETYEFAMRISHPTTVSNLLHLINLRNRVKSHLKIRMSMALIAGNDGHVREFLKEWGSRVDSVSVNKVHTYGDTVENAAAQHLINFQKIPFPCKYLWNTITIGASGDIFLCCLDYEGQYALGNIKNEPILNIFYSEQFNNIRNRHFSRMIGDLKICARCYTPYKNGVEWFIDHLY